jgi:transketolase
MMAIATAPKDSNHVSLRDVFGQQIVEVGARNPNLVILDADLATSTRTEKFRKKYPERHLNVGIAEQNMVGIAAGIALCGGMPFVNTFAAFLTRRACDQIAISVAYPRLNVKFFGFHSGINLGEDGATQQAVEDVGIMQAIPGIRVYAPIDANELLRAINEVVQYVGPTYIRLSRFPSPLLTPAVRGPDERVSDYTILREGKHLLLFTTGTVAGKALAAVTELEKENLSIKVIGVTRIKPLADNIADLIAQASTVPIAVVEEHNIHGGLSDALSALLDEKKQLHQVTRIGIQDRFGESGDPEALLEAFGLAGEPLIKRLREAILR